MIAASLVLCSCAYDMPRPTEVAPDTVAEPELLPAQENEEPDVPIESGNLVPSGDFTEPSGAWGMYTESGGSADFDISDGTLTVRIANPGTVEHAVQLYCEGFEMLEGAKYAFSAEISSDVPRYFEWRIQINGGDYHPYVDLENVSIGPEKTRITSEFTMNETSDAAPRMCFNLGDKGSAQGLGSHNIYISDLSLVMTDGSKAKKVDIMGEQSDINVNQIGYRPLDEKRAVLRDFDKDTEFEVVDRTSGKTVFTGRITKGNTLGSSGDNVGYADLSELTTPGKYFIRCANSGESYDFTIGEGVYDDALIDSLRMLYLQRCGIALPKELAGNFEHAACHTEEAQIYGGKEYVEVAGGWHDAGDYGRYASPAAKAIADLLLAYECFPDSFGDANNIPESGNGIPDVLDEARYELDWLHKMQSDDGGVYHKVTGVTFDGFVRADECTEKLYLFAESKTATADFAGVMYMAARVYEQFDKEFADKCRRAADRALAAYVKHKDDRNFTNPPDVDTGEYLDSCSQDEYLWAICEGYKTTGDKRFEEMLPDVDMTRIKVDDFGWEDMSGYAYYAYLTADKPMAGGSELKERFYRMCDDLKELSLNGESYGGTIRDDYPWGSNMTIANNGMALLMAHKLTGNGDYLRAAKRQLDYLFGTNTTSYCFLTGYGTKSPKDPHHRPSQAVGECMKGMLVGGPDSFLEDPYAKAVLTGVPKAHCYTDDNRSYSCNEITIYWNSPLCFMLAGLK